MNGVLFRYVAAYRELLHGYGFQVPHEYADDWDNHVLVARKRS